MDSISIATLPKENSVFHWNPERQIKILLKLFHYERLVMAKFSVGDCVYHKDTNKTGQVTSLVVDKKSVKVRWIGNLKAENKLYSAQSLEGTTLRPFVMEGNLADDLSDYGRTEQNLLRTWLDASNIKLAFKSIHQLSDIELLAKMMGKSHPPFIHISCHGQLDSNKGPFIQLTPGNSIYLNDPETIRVFSLFEGFPLFFSACLLGVNEGPMQEFRRRTKLGSIAASTREIYDHEAMLFGLMLYQCTLVNGLTFETAVEQSLKACSLLKIKGKSGKGQSYVRIFSAS